MHFGATLRLLRTQSGLSLSALAGHVGVSTAYLSRVEHGHDAPPTVDRLRAIEAALGLPANGLVDLVEDLRPDALAWLDRLPEGRRLAAELHRRRLAPAQLARVIQFVRMEFPLAGSPGGDLGLTPARVLLGVRVASLADALEVAALRLGGPEIGRALVAQARGGSGAVGGGLVVAHAEAREVAAALVVLAVPLELPTPDGEAVRVVLALTGPREQRTETLVAAVRLADRDIVSGLIECRDAAVAVDKVRRALQG